MASAKDILNGEYRQMLNSLGKELPKSKIHELIFLFFQLPDGMVEEILDSRTPATILFNKLELEQCISYVNVTDLAKNLEQVNLKKAAQIVYAYINRNTNVIKEVRRLDEEAKLINEDATSSTKPTAKKNDAEEKTKAQVFVSFKFGPLKKHVESVVEKLKNSGVNCWICTDDIDGGANISQQIIEAIIDCKIFLCMISKTYADSTKCEEEVGVAKDRKKHIIPIYIEEVTKPLAKSDGSPSALELDLKLFKYLKLFDVDNDKDYQSVLEAIELKLGNTTQVEQCVQPVEDAQSSEQGVQPVEDAQSSDIPEQGVQPVEDAQSSDTPEQGVQPVEDAQSSDTPDPDIPPMKKTRYV